MRCFILCTIGVLVGFFAGAFYGWAKNAEGFSIKRYLRWFIRKNFICTFGRHQWYGGGEGPNQTETPWGWQSPYFCTTCHIEGVKTPDGNIIPSFKLPRLHS